MGGRASGALLDLGVALGLRGIHLPRLAGQRDGRDPGEGVGVAGDVSEHVAP